MSSTVGRYPAKSLETGSERDEEFRATLQAYLTGYRRTQRTRTRPAAAKANQWAALTATLAALTATLAALLVPTQKRPS